MPHSKRNYDFAIAAPLLAMLVTTPWFFGGVWNRTQSILLGVCGVLLLVDVALTFRTNRRRTPFIPAAFYPLIGGILLGLLQLWPLNADGANKFSPGAVQWRAAADYPEATTAQDSQIRPSHSRPRTLYAPTTRENVALLLLVTSVFWLASRRFTGERTASLLFVGITVCGVAIALFALVQRFTWNGQIYWTFPLSQGGGAYGPFVNRNNAGGFLNLCLAVGLGCYVWESGGGLKSLRNRQRQQFGPESAEFGAARLMIVGALVFIAGAIVASASRGSVASLAVAMAVVTAGMLTRRGQRSQAIGVGIAGAAAMALVVWLGQLEEVQARFTRLATGEEATDGRFLNWAEAAQALPDFWVLGSGLNTYRFVCPPFQDRFTSNRWHYYAENQYIQALVDGGLVGLVLLLLAISLVAYAIFSLYRKGGSLNTALATMGSFALASQVVGGAFDFGLYLGANAILMATICGTVVGRAGQQIFADRETLQKPFEQPTTRWQWLNAKESHVSTVAATSLVLLLGAGFGALELFRAADVEKIVEPAVQGKIDLERDENALVSSISVANEALRWRADDANGHRALSELWIQRYRVAAFRSLRQQQPWLDEEESWQSSSLLRMNLNLRDQTPEQRQEFESQVRSDKGSQSLLQPAWNHAQRAQAACPWHPQTYLTLASLAPFVGGNPDSSEHLVRARLYAGGDPSLWYRIGLLEQVAGRLEPALDSWKRCLKLSSQFENAILADLLGVVSMDQILAILPNDPRAKLTLARRLQADFPEEATTIAKTTLAMLADNGTIAMELDEDERLALQAGLLQTLDDHPAAVGCWQKALALSPRRIDWRGELAKSLLANGDASQADNEVRKCLEQDPDSKLLRDLLQRTTKAMIEQTKTD